MLPKSPYRKHPNFPQFQALGCGWSPDLPACSPCGATPPPCAWVPRGRPTSEPVPAPGTPSCGPLENIAGPGPQPVSSWTWRRPSHSAAASGTVTPWRYHWGGTAATDLAGRGKGMKETQVTQVRDEKWLRLEQKTSLYREQYLCTLCKSEQKAHLLLSAKLHLLFSASPLTVIPQN